MEATPQLVDALFQDKVRQARGMAPEDKLLAGVRLFELACEISRAGIRHQHPDATPAEVEAELRRRLELGRRIEETPLEL